MPHALPLDRPLDGPLELPLEPGLDARPATPALVVVLALLTAVAPLAIDMYLPAFPDMADDLGTSATGIQLTLTAFLVGLAVGQLVVGPLSDRIGRRRPLLLGSLLCLVASVACALAPSVGVLAGARLIQGLSGAAGVVLARAIVADTSRGAAAARLLGVLLIISVIAPVAAPLGGGAIIATVGWRGVFWVQAALVLAMLVGAALLVHESLPAAARTRGGLRATLADVRHVLGDRTYVGYLLTFAFAFAALFAYIAASPFVVQNVLGLSETTFTLVFSLNALAITVTSGAAASLAGKVAYRRMIALGLVVAGAVGVGLLVAVLAGVPTVPTLALFTVFQGSLGLVFGNATTLALAQTGAHAGTGSAFLGFGQFTLAAIVSPLVGIRGETTATPMAVVLLCCLAGAVVAFVTLTRDAGVGTTPRAADVIRTDHTA
ncbi:multidrug effflux MFS transporter [Cellulomonas soli]|uniref:multidrug effflux MFS transporter n=1 Tax=Cellulomonas soli TaxID=931535 RepID=UPI003F85F23B